MKIDFTQTLRRHSIRGELISTAKKKGFKLNRWAKEIDRTTRLRKLVAEFHKTGSKKAALALAKYGIRAYRS